MVASTTGNIWQSNPGLAFPEEEWATTRASQRALRIKRRLLESERQIDIERARYTTESYQDTEGEPMILRRAKMLMHLVSRMSITIHPDERLVGNRSLLPRMGVIAPEGGNDWIDEELEILATRPQDPFQITQEQIKELREEIFPYWRGKTLEDSVEERVPSHIQKVIEGKAFSLNQTDHAQGHILPDVESWLQLGVKGLREKVNMARQQPDRQTDEEQLYYDAASIVSQAAGELIRRYGQLAGELAETSESVTRKRELQKISESCLWLAENPARDFQEALQATWFLFVILQIESNASSFSPGRLDQYLLPYLEQDLETGRLSLPKAQERLEHLWLKFNEIVLLRSSDSARYFAGFPIGFNIVTGGQLADGRDATNLLSYMCLRAQANLGMTQPNLSIRIHEDSPDDFLRATSYVIGKGSGMPQVFNDEVIIPAQINRGVAPEDAINYAVVGCVELSTPGKALGWSDASMFNLTRILELTLFGGKDPQSGEQFGLETPPLNEMGSFDDLQKAYDRQLTYFVQLMVQGCNVVDGTHADTLPSPFLSLFIDDCIQQGLDVTQGGAVYNFTGVQGVQIANVADSLAAIDLAVFDEKWLTADELLTVLKSNFENHEALRQRFINRIPKFGNDDDRVDTFAHHWAQRYCELVEQHPTVRGGLYQPGFYTVSAHIPMGANVGATPDGRQAGTPLADGGLSPTAGRDKCGPTAVLNSIGKMNLKLASNGTLLNMKFLPGIFVGSESIEKFVSLLRGFCSLKIPHVQFNVVSANELRKAQANPDAYGSLVVRVAGYSAYFVELDQTLQDEIIRRTGYSSV